MNTTSPKGTIRREITSFTIDAGIAAFGNIDSIIEKALINNNYDLDITPIKDESGHIIKENIKVFIKETIQDQYDNVPKCY